MKRARQLHHLGAVRRLHALDFGLERLVGGHQVGFPCWEQRRDGGLELGQLAAQQADLLLQRRHFTVCFRVARVDGWSRSHVTRINHTHTRAHTRTHAHTHARTHTHARRHADTQGGSWSQHDATMTRAALLRWAPVHNKPKHKPEPVHAPPPCPKLGPAVRGRADGKPPIPIEFVAPPPLGVCEDEDAAEATAFATSAVGGTCMADPVSSSRLKY